jgi:hypothetical protein
MRRVVISNVAAGMDFMFLFDDLGVEIDNGFSDVDVVVVNLQC